MSYFSRPKEKDLCPSGQPIKCIMKKCTHKMKTWSFTSGHDGAMQTNAKMG